MIRRVQRRRRRRRRRRNKGKDKERGKTGTETHLQQSLGAKDRPGALLHYWRWLTPPLAAHGGSRSYVLGRRDG
jgi:hypothetical protein